MRCKEIIPEEVILLEEEYLASLTLDHGVPTLLAYASKILVGAIDEQVIAELAEFHTNTVLPANDVITKPNRNPRLSKYAIRKEHRRPGTLKAPDHRYLDANYHFTLAYDGRAVATTGFDPQPEKLTIVQIQGRKGDRELLEPFRWEVDGIQRVEDLAKKLTVPLVEIVAAKNNPWVLAGAIPLERAYKRYDLNARNLDYQKQRNGNYTKQIL